MSNDKSQYNGQSGNGYQPLHCAPTPPPGPEVGTPTLADVQPGGRVRLGDHPKDGEVLVEVSGLTGSDKSAIAGEIEILCKTLGLEVEWINGDEEKRLTHADWIGALEMYKPKVVIVEQNIPRAALSAQPSPGGQGDVPFAFSERAKADALEAGQYAFTEADGKDLGYTACIEACVDAICLVLELPEHLPALAARQPVGEIPSEVLSAISGLAHIAKANVSSLADKHVAIIDAWLYAAPTAQAVVLSPSQSVLAEVARERARQEAKWGQQNHVDWTPTSAATDLAGAWPAGVGDHFKFITDYKAKGAEGHRLGYFDILMEEVAEAHDEARDGDTKATRAELVQVAAVAVAWIECIDRRLAKVDSQAVGNG